MMNGIDIEAYKPPEGYSTLAYSWRFRETVTKPSNLNDLPLIAQELGFQRIADFSTRNSRWQVFDRQSHLVPNFSVAATRISSTLAVYDRKGELTHAILRTSRKPFQSEDFTRDLAAFTKHYVERPRLLGFPSELLTNGKTHLAIFGGGIPVGGAIGYLASGGDITVASLGALAGETIPVSISASLWALSERHARRQISSPEQYVTGDSAQGTLLNERYHNVTVDIQTELYRALLEEDADLDPNQFLEKIYGQIPRALVIERHAEVEQTKYPRLDSPRETGNSLSRLIEVSHVLQSIESYLSMAHALKTDLDLK